jgi:nucleoside-diphosphate-sugar epimerase
MVKPKTEKVLITGGTGFVGKYLVNTLLKAELKVYNPNRETLNLLDYNSTNNYLKDLNPKYVIHLACTSSHPKDCNDKELIVSDLDMIHNLIEAMYKNTKLIISGSVSEYGKSGVLSENKKCYPDTCYGIAKFRSNTLASKLCKKKNIDLLVLRLFGVYGPGEAAYRLFPSLLESIKNNVDFHMSDGLQIRDFIHVSDVCSVIKLILNLKKFPTGILNLGTGIGLQLIDVCNKIIKESSSLNIKLIHSKPRHLTDKDILVSNNKAIEALLGLRIPQRLNQKNILDLFDLNYCDKLVI